MIVDLCKACYYFVDNIKTPKEQKPKHCACPQLASLFSRSFINGTKIVHCDYFQQFSPHYGDIMLTNKDGNKCVSYVISSERKAKDLNYMYNNLQNIRCIKTQSL